MNNLNLLDEEPIPDLKYFKVIFVGPESINGIEEVKKFFSDCVDCITAYSPNDCIPTSYDQMAIIVADKHESIANAIAKKYHDLGVLTLGLLNNADSSCYDSVIKNITPEKTLNIIYILLRPIVYPSSVIQWDLDEFGREFHDLKMTLRNSGSFIIRSTDGKNIEDTIMSWLKSIDAIDTNRVENILSNFYFNRNMLPTSKIDAINLHKQFSKIYSKFPESTYFIWGIDVDNSLPNGILRFATIMSGKDL